MADFILDPGETIVEHIPRYWIELVWPFIMGLMIVALVIFNITFYPSPANPYNFVPFDYILIIDAALLLVAVLINVAAYYVFRHNYILITNKHLIKVQQSGLFAKQTSELAMGNIEDVKGGRAGLLGTVLDFGDIEVQTAGASENFIFHTVLHPQLVADRIMQYSEDYRHHHPH